jgi:hypothetical protein
MVFLQNKRLGGVDLGAVVAPLLVSRALCEAGSSHRTKLQEEFCEFLLIFWRHKPLYPLS